jgi:hypothetical protein
MSEMIAGTVANLHNELRIIEVTCSAHCSEKGNEHDRNFPASLSSVFRGRAGRLRIDTCPQSFCFDGT